MRGSRAKMLRKQAHKNPGKLTSGWYQGTLIHGGARGTYRALKKKWRQRFLTNC